MLFLNYTDSFRERQEKYKGTAQAQLRSPLSRKQVGWLSLQAAARSISLHRYSNILLLLLLDLQLGDTLAVIADQVAGRILQALLSGQERDNRIPGPLETLIHQLEFLLHPLALLLVPGEPYLYDLAVASDVEFQSSITSPLPIVSFGKAGFIHKYSKNS